MSETRTRKSRGAILQQDGSYLVRFRRREYSVRLRRHAETGTWEVDRLWDRECGRAIPVAPKRRGDAWEALLSGELSRTPEEALQAAQRQIERWLSLGEERAAM